MIVPVFSGLSAFLRIESLSAAVQVKQWNTGHCRPVTEIKTCVSLKKHLSARPLQVGILLYYW